MPRSEMPINQDGETLGKYAGKTGTDQPYERPKDAGAKDEIFSGPAIDSDNIIITAYRYSPKMPLRDWKEAGDFHPAGESPAFVHFGALDPPKLNEVLPDVIGLGEGEATPFSAQRGEMPEAEGKFMPATTTEGFVQAKKPVKSDVPANR